jgi:hypothetical protein
MVCLLRSPHEKPTKLTLRARDKRIFSTGCAGVEQPLIFSIGVNLSLLIEGGKIDVDENAKMTDCYYATKDWRVCKKEVRCFPSPL